MTGYSLKEISTRLNTGQIPQVAAGKPVYTQEDLVGAIGNINSPLLDMPLKNSLAMKAGVGSATFTRASTATYIDRYGVLKTATIDEPRFEKEGYLNEGASTNLLLYSEQFENTAGWSTGSSSGFSANTTIDPYGTSLADTVTENTALSTHYFIPSAAVNSSVSFTSGVAYTFSIFAKAKERSAIQIVPTGTYFPITYANFDLTSGTVSALGSNASAEIEALSNGWYRCSVTCTATSSGSGNTVFYTMANSPTMSRFAQYQGDGVSGLYIFGAQLEALPFASSYIPTVASTVTRSADILKVAYANNAPELNSSMTVSADINVLFPSYYSYVAFVWNFYNEDRRSFAVIGNVTQGERKLRLRSHGLDTVQYVDYNLPYLARTAVTIDSVAKTQKIFNNGVQTSSTSYTANNTLLSVQYIEIGNAYGTTTNAFYGHISNFRIYDKALTAQEVALA